MEKIMTQKLRFGFGKNWSTGLMIILLRQQNPKKFLIVSNNLLTLKHVLVD